MPTKRKRPLGITLLALPFLWIGCLGTLIFPIVVGFTGRSIWEFLSPAYIRSSALGLLVTVLIVLTWFGFYVLYAFIGIGLWKLRLWGLKALVIVAWTGVGGGIVVSLFCFAQPFLGLMYLVFFAGVPGLVLWYLKRPTIIAAFQLAGPTPEGSVSASWIRSHRGIAIGVLIAIGGLLGGLGLLTVDRSFRSNEAYKAGLSYVQQSPCAISKLGNSITAKGMISGSASESDSKGSANLSIPLRGSKAKGDLLVDAKKADGVWSLTALALDQDGKQTQILPEPATCQ